MFYFGNIFAFENKLRDEVTSKSISFLIVSLPAWIKFLANNIFPEDMSRYTRNYAKLLVIEEHILY